MFASSSKSTKVHPTSLLCVSAHAGCVINPGDKIQVSMPGFFEVDKLTCVINGAPFGWSVQVDTNPDIDPGVAPEKMARSYHEYNDTGKIIKIIEQTLSKLKSLIHPHRILSGIIPSDMNTLLGFLDDDELVMFTEILRQQILKNCDIEIERLEPGNIQDPDKKLNLQIFQPGNNMLMRIYDLEDLGAAFGSLIRFHEDEIVLDNPGGSNTRTGPKKQEITNQEIFGSIPAERILFCDFGCWGVDMYLDPREQRRNNLDIIKYLKEVDTRTQTILEKVIAKNAEKFSKWQAKLEYSGEAALGHSGEDMEEYSEEEDDDISLGGNRKTRKQRKNKRNKTNRRNNKKNNKTNKRNWNKRRRTRK
jgi:hypothetical protein